MDGQYFGKKFINNLPFLWELAPGLVSTTASLSATRVGTLPVGIPVVVSVGVPVVSVSVGVPVVMPVGI